MKKLGLSIAFSIIAVFSLNAQTAPDGAELTRLLNDFLAGAGRNDASIHERF